MSVYEGKWIRISSKHSDPVEGKCMAVAFAPERSATSEDPGGFPYWAFLIETLNEGVVSRGFAWGRPLPIEIIEPPRASGVKQ